MLRNKIRYLLILISLGLLSVLYNEYIMGIILLMVVAMPFLLFGLLSYIYGKLSVGLESLVHVTNKEEVIPVSFLFHNPTIFPIPNLTVYLTYKNSYSKMKYKKVLQVSLDRKAKTRVVCNFLSEYAGNLEIVLQGVRLFDYLKIFSLKKKPHDEIKIAILPNFYEIEETYIINRSQNMVESDYYSLIKSGDDPSSVFAIREYREGDRLQRIHWKLSAKEDKLMIKEFSEPLNCSVLSFVNLCIPERKNTLVYMDALMECALSLSYSFLTRGQIHYFAWYDYKQGVCRRVRVVQEEDLYEALDDLLSTLPYSKEIDAFSAYQAEYPHEQYTDMFFISSDISKELLDALSLIKTNTRQIIYVGDRRELSWDGDIEEESQLITDEVFEESKERDIGVAMVSIGNMKADIQELRFD
ncbi:MAG TPA: DUF58 domain-containing protein [Clostridiales bacterium]|nr:DUF58 domain-containing protein [Clostridiales bacterium]